ncbi:PAS domain S-box protein [Desulfopila sp. IMCC35006]|uniref:PAS domain-containing sensor histidine kinase n=1 Tax=Desulfopila sp. IMCC35006 TaxID=2569542 RepID=UPI00142E9C2B|nr:PAS domain S-box protein [Desulfopila sp. IMCC35006]
MPISQRISALFPAGKFIWVGIGTAALYWILESFLHVLFFGGSRFVDELITPDVHEIWKRILVISLLIAFGIFAQQYFILRKRSENALKESEEKYRTIFEQALNPIFLFDDGGRFVDSNRSALLFLECTREESLKKTLTDITAGKSTKEYFDTPLLIDERRIVEIEYPVKGSTKTMLLNLVPLNGKTRNFIYGIGQDISERKQMERTLQEAHAELDQIFQTASVGMRVIDKDYNVVKINKTFAMMAGVTEADAVARKCYEIFSGPMCQTAGCPINQIMSGQSHFETYVDKKRSDGQIIPSILTATPFIGPDGAIVGIVESFRDITQLKDAHEIIHSERDKLQCILSHLLEGVSIVAPDYTIEYQNEILIEDLGDCRGKPCYTVFMGKNSPCSPCLMQKAIDTGRSQHIEYETSDGRIFEQAYTRIFDIDGKDKAVALLRDITAKKTSLASAMHADRLVAVGELAAGVAHEINNPINSIINYAQIVSNKTDKGDIVHDVAGRVIKEGNRIARIVESLLTFSRRRHEGKTVTCVSDILSETLTLTTAQMRQDNIILTVKMTDNLPNVMVQAHEIEQVFVNIISNARYALMQKYPHRHNDKLLEITTALATVKDGCYVRISFLDHGTGIPAAIIDKVKNPFFSTKKEGKSTGLGLSISHGIVDNHGGNLTILSQEGLFTRIDVDLPVWNENRHPGV